MKPSHSAIFPTGTYAGIGMCAEFENVVKSATKKTHTKKQKNKWIKKFFFIFQTTSLITVQDYVAELQTSRLDFMDRKIFWSTMAW